MLDGVTDLAWLVSFERPTGRTLKTYLSLTPPYGGFLERREPKFKLVKTMFNVENLTCTTGVLLHLQWFWHNVHLKCVPQPKIAKKSIKTIFRHSRSSKVIDFGANQKPVYDFLLVVYSNLSLISQRFWDNLFAKNCKFSLPQSHLTLLLGWPLSNFWKSFTDTETKVFQAADSKDLVILAWTVFDWSTHVTDRLTELWWLRCTIAVLAVTLKNQQLTC